MARKRNAEDIVSLKVRFTEAMRGRIEQEAKKNQRSLNGEIVYRLGTTFGAEGVSLVAQFEDTEKEIAKHLREIVERLVAELPKKDR
jgi:predicted Ser/Thr protein kinase